MVHPFPDGDNFTALYSLDQSLDLFDANTPIYGNFVLKYKIQWS